MSWADVSVNAVAGPSLTDTVVVVSSVKIGSSAGPAAVSIDTLTAMLTAQQAYGGCLAAQETE